MPTSKIANYSGWFIIAIAALFAVITSYGSYTYNRFERRVNQLDSTGELTSLDDLVHVVENELDDANFYLRKAVDSKDGDFNEVISFDEFGNIICDSDSISLLERLETDHPDFFENLKLAADAPDVSIDVNDMEQSNSLISVHQSTLVLAWKGVVLVEQNNGASACDVAIDLLKIADHFERPFLINTLLSLSLRERAWKILDAAARKGLLSNMDQETLTSIYKLLDGRNYLEGYENALKTERSVVTFNMLNSKQFYENNEASQSRIASLASKFPAGPTILAGNAYLDQMELAIERSRTPFSVTIPYDKSDERWTTLTYFGGDLNAAFTNFREKFGEHVARGRVIRIILALAANADAANRASWSPEYLQSLGVPKSSTLDPFTEDPFIVNRSNDQWQVYSLGFNQKDDGGVRDLDIGIGLPNLAQ